MKKKSFMLFLLLTFPIVAISSFYALKTKNTEGVRPAPYLQNSKSKPEFDQLENWQIYSNDVFTIKVPSQFKFADIDYVNKSQMIFGWSDSKTNTQKQGIGLDIGYIPGDDKLNYCKTNKECFDILAKPFKVGDGYKMTTAEIDGKSVDGFEKIQYTSNPTSHIYWIYYPVSIGGKLFAIDFQIHTNSVEESRQFIPLINQILSTIQFI